MFSRNALPATSHVPGGASCSTPALPPAPSLKCAQACLLISSPVMKWTLLLPFLHLSIDSVLVKEGEGITLMKQNQSKGLGDFEVVLDV